MSETKVTVQTISKNLDKNRDAEVLNSALVIEAASYPEVHVCIKLTGEYEKQYSVIMEYEYLTEHRILIDGNLMFICFMFELVIVDLDTDKLLKRIDFDTYEIFEIHKFKSGYFVYTEGASIFMDSRFEVVYELWCGDIFANIKTDKCFEIFEDHVEVLDWFGVKHFYNEEGEYKTKHYPHLDCNAD